MHGLQHFAFRCTCGAWSCCPDHPDAGLEASLCTPTKGFMPTSVCVCPYLPLQFQALSPAPARQPGFYTPPLTVFVAACRCSSMLCRQPLHLKSYCPTSLTMVSLPAPAVLGVSG